MEPFTESELAGYTELVKAAVGYDEQRGDVVILTNGLFYDENAVRNAAPIPWYLRLQRQEFFGPLIKYLALLLVFMLIYLIFVRPLRKRVYQAIEAANPPLPPAEENLLLAAGESTEAAEPGVEALPEGEPAEQLLETSFEPEEDAFDLENATEEQIEDMLSSEEIALGGSARRYAVIKKKMIDKARKNPELISQLIRSLMQEKAKS
jgi:flagellar biosynthesis/type III secretory pathway M-ring protein FliF/YscJ